MVMTLKSGNKKSISVSANFKIQTHNPFLIETGFLFLYNSGMASKLDNIEKIPLPESEKPKEKYIEPNSKPSWMNKIASGVIDLCLIILGYFALYMIFTSTPMASYLNSQRTEIVTIIDNYKLVPLVEGSLETYGHKLYDFEEDYKTYNGYQTYNDEIGTYIVVDNKKISEPVKEAYKNAVNSDQKYINARFNYRLVDYGFAMLSFGIAEFIVLFLIPLLNKRSASPGKLCNNMMMVSYKFHTRCKWYQLLGRFLFTFLIGTALPYLWIDTWTLLLTPGVYLIVSLISKDGRSIHDYINRTLVIDKASHKPMVDHESDIIDNTETPTEK